MKTRPLAPLSRLSIAGAAALALATAGHAQTITGSFTVDNNYSVWIGDANSVTTNVVPDKTNTVAQDIRQGETFSFPYSKGCRIYVVTWSDDAVYQGMVGSFSGGVTIKTGDPQIQVAASGINFQNGPGPSAAQISSVIPGGGVSGWVAPFVGPTVAAHAPHFNIYDPLVVPGLDPTAKWVWHDSGKHTASPPLTYWPGANRLPFRGFNHDEFLVWRIPCDELVVDGGGEDPKFTGCLKDAQAKITCNKDGTYTLTMTGAGTPGTVISLASSTSGVTVTPPQQPWAASTTWTIGGATPGQAVTLTANATTTGGGSADGTDQCCSGEIKITMPECPKDQTTDISVEKVGEALPQGDGYKFTLRARNEGGPLNGPATVTVSDVVPAGMTFTAVSASNWTCTPPTPIAGGGTLSCTYTGTFPLTPSQWLGQIDITATGGSGPYKNCALAGVEGITDVKLSNNESCVTVSKGGNGYMRVEKVVENKTNATLASLQALTFPVTATCGGNNTALNVKLTAPGVVTGIPVGTVCTAVETTVPPPPSANCGEGRAPAWVPPPTYTPPSVTISSGAGPVITIKNVLECRPVTHGGVGEIIVKKVASYAGPILLPAQNYPVTVTCGSALSNLSLAVNVPQTVSNIPVNTSCTVAEPTPPVPANVCPPNRTPVWTTTYVPSNTVVIGSSAASVTVNNLLKCEEKQSIPVSLQCKPPLVPNPMATSCVCRPGLVMRGGKCVEQVACRAPAKLNRAGTGCNCPEDMVKQGNGCAPRGPRITPTDVIRVIPGIGFPGGGGDRRGGGGEPRGGGSPAVR